VKSLNFHLCCNGQSLNKPHQVPGEWRLHFKEHFEAGNYLSLQDDLDVTTAIGKFHLGAHIQQCFPLHSLNFIFGAGQLDGEILETLWSSLDKVAGFTRLMSQAHWQEVLDDYMADSNQKKSVTTGKWTCFKCVMHLISSSSPNCEEVEKCM
jgi:Kyakuja-Dileera-Zisupton transposase